MLLITVTLAKIIFIVSYLLLITFKVNYSFCDDVVYFPKLDQDINTSIQEVTECMPGKTLKLSYRPTDAVAHGSSHLQKLFITELKSQFKWGFTVQC